MNNHWLLIFFMLLDWQSLEFLLLFILWMWKVQPTNPSSATATRKKPLEKAADGAGEVLQRKNYASLVISNHLHLSTDFSLHWTVKPDNLLKFCVLDQWLCISHHSSSLCWYPQSLSPTEQSRRKRSSGRVWWTTLQPGVSSYQHWRDASTRIRDIIWIESTSV